MNSFPCPQGSDLDRLRRTFGEIEEAEALLQSAARARTPASALYAAACSGADPEGDVLHSRHARDFYRRAVAASALFSFPEARAASSGAALTRHGEGCRIRTERSRAEPDQFFVVIELIKDDRRPAPTSLVVCDADGRCRRFPLPPVRHGVVQLITEENSDLMRLIGDPAVRVYLT